MIILQHIIDYLPLINALSIPFFLLFGQSYFKKKGELKALREEFREIHKQLIQNTVATEEIKYKTQRKADARTKAMNEILTALAEIDVTRRNWQFFVYFRKKKLTETSIEEIGMLDLSDISEQLNQYLLVVTRNTIHFNDEVKMLALKWFEQVYNILYRMEAVYRASEDYHKDKIVTDGDKITWMLKLLETEVSPLEDEISQTKSVLTEMISVDFNSHV
ncbi:hypothetical protein [Vibrio sp. AND4]|uniref:hypothetical protein n=1 Tax=Vibrio sp. AND4 TaxID=314289 RepID=UPI00015EFF8E|nr:hypothetical protein [Vibrio sp. AND4]EDP59472.1 hypothetical protein AND4_09872 [Vibrio sp. AND4]